MPKTFMPPTVLRTPAVLPDSSGVTAALFRHVRPMSQGQNLWKMPDGSYLLDAQPAFLSNPDPVNQTDAASTPVFTYYGGHLYVVSDVEAAALSAAGYGTYLQPGPNTVDPRQPATFNPTGVDITTNLLYGLGGLYTSGYGDAY